MKIIFKKILQFYLKYITKFVLILHQPTVIAIAGSTNKTFVKDEINKILKKEGIDIRSNPKSFNTEIGLPLAILNLPSGYNSYKNWLPTIIKAPFAIFKINFPDVLVLELGVSDPGDMKDLLSVVKPKIIIITDITQRYLESFDDMDELASEYEYLIKKARKNALIILNYDNHKVNNLANISDKTVEFFGLNDGANWQALDVIKEKRGQKVKIAHDNIVNNYNISRFGKHHIYSLLVSLIIKNYVQKEKKI